MATFKKGRRKTFDLATLSMVAVMKHDGINVLDISALMGGSSGKTGDSMQSLVVPTKFLALIAPGTALPIKWTVEMTEELKDSVPDNYKNIMAEHFFKSFLVSKSHESETRTVRALQRKFQYHDLIVEKVKFCALK